MAASVVFWDNFFKVAKLNWISNQSIFNCISYINFDFYNYFQKNYALFKKFIFNSRAHRHTIFVWTTSQRSASVPCRLLQCARVERIFRRNVIPQGMTNHQLLCKFHWTHSSNCIYTSLKYKKLLEQNTSYFLHMYPFTPQKINAHQWNETMTWRALSNHLYLSTNPKNLLLLGLCTITTKFLSVSGNWLLYIMRFPGNTNPPCQSGN